MENAAINGHTISENKLRGKKKKGFGHL